MYDNNIQSADLVDYTFLEGSVCADTDIVF